MKSILLIALLVGGSSGVPQSRCIKAIDVKPCLNCNSMFSLVCIDGDDWQSCQKSTWGCVDNNPKPGTNVRCRQDIAGNSCDQQQQE